MATQTKHKPKQHLPKTTDKPVEEPIATQIETEPAPPTWFTLETLLYGVVIALALALRLWNLGQYPLTDDEAQQSLIALQLYEGQRLEAVANYSPLLVSLNALVFFLIHESDASARLASVLFGSGLVLLPLTLRRQLGSRVCLLASALLAISPAAIFLSRTLNSEIAVAVGALMAVSGFFNWTEDGQQRWLYLAAGGVAVALTAGPMAYSIIVVFALIVLLRLADFRERWTQGARLAAEGEADSQKTETRSARRKSGEESENKGLNLNFQQAGIFLAAALILFSTAATLNLSGFGVTTSLFSDWLSRFSLQTGPNAGFNAVFLLTIYEPFLVMAGLAGLAYAIFNRNLLRLTFAGWFVGALILDLVMAGRPNGNIILSLAPLAFLGAFVLAELWESVQKWGGWNNEGIILASGLVIAVFGYIGLMGWIVRSCADDDMFCQFAWLQAGAALVLFLVIVAFFWFINGTETALRGIAVTGVAIGLIAVLNIGWRLNYGPLMNLAYQPLAGIPPSTELVALTQTLASESSRRVGDTTLLDITLVKATPALQWQLRDYRYQTRVNSMLGVPPASVIVTPTPTEQEFSMDDAYIGQDFAVNAIWSPVGMQSKELINWLIYRQTSRRPQSDKVVLWLRWDARQ